MTFMEFLEHHIDEFNLREYLDFLFILTIFRIQILVFELFGKGLTFYHHLSLFHFFVAFTMLTFSFLTLTKIVTLVI